MNSTHHTQRPAAVAGLFYPGDAVELRATLARLLGNAAPASVRPPRALIVPHAGYVYSGAVAAAAYRRLAHWRDAYHRVVLLGPPHRVPVRGAATVSADRFGGPLGSVAVDHDALAAPLARGEVVIDDAAHAAEHALEVQLPFLQSVLDTFTLVPLLIGEMPAAATARLIAPWWEDPGTLVVVSTDLSHFLDDAGARQLDAVTDGMIMALDEHGLTPEHACGCRALAGLLHLARARGAHIERAAQCNSGDTAGPRGRVVGYAAYVLDDGQ